MTCLNGYSAGGGENNKVYSLHDEIHNYNYFIHLRRRGRTDQQVRKEGPSCGSIVLIISNHVICHPHTTFIQFNGASSSVTI